MSIDAERPERFINPRPGVVKALGIANIVISLMMGVCVFTSASWVLMAAHAGASRPAAKLVASPPAGSRTLVVVSVESLALFGMDDPAFLRFSILDAVTGLLANVLMFASGVGLVNLRRWGARWWYWLAWSKIIRLVAVWGLFIVAVLPSLSENMGRYAVSTFQMARGKAPNVADLTRVYAVTNLILAVGMMGLGSIYPAISIWLLGRPGVRAALVARSPEESNLP